MSKLHTHYDTLQVVRNAGPEVIRAAYKTLSQRWHPDRNPDQPEHAGRIMQTLNVAFSVLSDPAQRAQYDAWLTEQGTYQTTREKEPSSGSTDAPSTGSTYTSHKPNSNSQTSARESRKTAPTTEPWSETESFTFAYWLWSGSAAKFIAASIMILVIFLIVVILVTSLSDTHEGRIVVVIGGTVAARVVLPLIFRYIAKLRDASNGAKNADYLAHFLTALVWGWFPFLLGMRFTSNLISLETLPILAIWSAAWIPAFGACRALLNHTDPTDLSWKATGGYLLLMSLILIGTFFVTHQAGNPLYQNSLVGLRGTALSLGFAHMTGAIVGAALLATILAAVLLGIGMLGSLVVATFRQQQGKPKPKLRVSALITGWAAIPVTYLLVFLASWLP